HGPGFLGRTGRAVLPLLLEPHAPIDLVTLMWGTNDVAPVYGLDAAGVGANCAALAWIVQKSLAGPAGGAPKILLVAPPPLGKLSAYMGIFSEGGQAASRALAGAYETVARGCGCLFLDAGRIVSASASDGMPLAPAAQRSLGEAILGEVRPALGLS